MSDVAQTIQAQLQLAFEVKDAEALQRAAHAIATASVDRRTYDLDMHGVRAEIRILADRMDRGFQHFDQRFEQMLHSMDKRFEQVDRRFEQVDRRFSSLQRFLGIGLTLMVVLMSVYEFVR